MSVRLKKVIYPVDREILLYSREITSVDPLWSIENIRDKQRPQMKINFYQASIEKVENN